MLPLDETVNKYSEKILKANQKYPYCPVADRMFVSILCGAGLTRCSIQTAQLTFFLSQAAARSC